MTGRWVPVEEVPHRLASPHADLTQLPPDAPRPRHWTNGPCGECGQTRPLFLLEVTRLLVLPGGAVVGEAEARERTLCPRCYDRAPRTEEVLCEV